MMKPGRDASSRHSYTIQALRRGLKVLDALLEARTPLALEAISTLTGLPKSTAFRIILNLLDGEYLVQTEEGYWLGLKMLRFGTLVEERLDLKRQAYGFLTALRDQVNETVHLGILDHEMRVVYVEKLPGQHAIGLMASRIGVTAPMHCTALGKAMAAFQPEGDVRQWVRTHSLRQYTDSTIAQEHSFLLELRQIRARGYAVDHAEYELGVHCIAAPIRDRTGQVVAAVSVSGPNNRMPEPLIGSSMAAEVVQTALHISQALGYLEQPGERLSANHVDVETSSIEEEP